MTRGPFRHVGAAALVSISLLPVAAVIAAPAGGGSYTITRKSLAESATFTVTQTLLPKDGAKFERVYRISVKGEKARADFDDPQSGASVRYVANDKGVFTYLPASKTAVKQSLKGGVEAALQLVFAQVRTQMAKAKKTGSSKVAGVPTTVFKTADGSSTVYWSEKPGFRLPIKIVQNNAGGTSTVSVSDIRLKPTLRDDLFVLPPGTDIVDNGESGGASASPAAR